MSVAKLKVLCAGKGWELVEKGRGRFQIVGAPLLVNVHLGWRSGWMIYVKGTVKGYRVKRLDQVIAAAESLPKIRRKPLVRKPNRKRRLKMWEKDPSCHWCKRGLSFVETTIDHVVPISRGGLDNRNNMVLACEKCNTGRGDKMPELKEKALLTTEYTDHTESGERGNAA